MRTSFYVIISFIKYLSLNRINQYSRTRETILHPCHCEVTMGGQKHSYESTKHRRFVLSTIHSAVSRFSTAITDGRVCYFSSSFLKFKEVSTGFTQHNVSQKCFRLKKKKILTNFFFVIDESLTDFTRVYSTNPSN